MRRPIRFQCVELWVLAGLPCVHTYMYICLFNSDFRKIRLKQGLPECNYCASWRVPVDYIQCPVLAIWYSKDGSFGEFALDEFHILCELGCGSK